MNELEVLEAARALITDPKRWTQGALARDVYGDQCFANVPRAVQWCAIGAIERVSSNDTVAKRGARHRLQSAAQVLHHDICEAAIMLPAAAVNDELDHAAVMRMYDVAIESCGGKPAQRLAEVIPLHILADVLADVAEVEHGNA